MAGPLFVLFLFSGIGPALLLGGLAAWRAWKDRRSRPGPKKR